MKLLCKLLFLSIVFISCDGNNENKTMNFALGDSKINAFTSSSEVVEEVDIQKNSDDNSIVSRKLIKNGNLSFETENLEQTKASILSLVQKYKGYISSDNQNAYGDRKTINVTIRIPAKHFDSILSGISKKVEKFDTKEIRISDVTEQFLDIESRLKNKKELEKKYLDILQKATSVQDILEVEKELGKLREDIEATEGRLKYLQNQVAYSTLSINFYKTITKTSNFGKKLKDGVSNGVENLKGFFIGLINIWPFVILLSILIIFIRKRLKRKNK